MTKAKSGNFVKVHFSCSLKDGSVIDTTEEKHPLGFTIGEMKYIPGFESAVEGMEPGEKKTITVPPDLAFGSHRDDLVIDLNKELFSDHIAPEIGEKIEVPLEGGGSRTMTVTRVDESRITLDANHPLAGKELIFEIELIEIGPGESRH